MIAVILWELRRRRGVLIWWCLGSAILIAGIMSIYPAIHHQADQLNKVFNQLPEGLRQFKTGGATSINLADPMAFLNSQLFYVTLPILWIILALSRGSAVLGREEQSHTLELLLARPLSRSRLLVSKALALILEFVAVGLVALAVIVGLAPSLGLHISTWHLVLATLYTLAFSLSFGLIAFALQASSSLTRRAASAIAILLSFGGYLVASLSSLTHWLINPAKLAPYHYFTPDKVLNGQPVHGLDIYLLGIVVLSVLISYFGFRRRDID